MSTRATAIVRNTDRGQEAYLYQHCDGYPEGFATTLRASLSEVFSANKVPSLLKALLPNGKPFREGLELDVKPHSHNDTSYRYEISQQGDKTEIVVLTRALDLTKPENGSVLEYDFHPDPNCQVQIFRGKLEEFYVWSEKYDPDSEESVKALQSASRGV